MRIHFGKNRLVIRYLTLFYGFTLGLALILAFFAIYQRGNTTSGTATITQVVLAQTASPTLGGIQEHSLSKPTSLPAIPPTPNEETPSPLSVTGAELRGVQVSLWHPWTGSTGAALQAILDEFNRTNQWGITVQASAYEGFGRLDEAVESAAISGTLPDVLVNYGYQAQHWDESGVVTDLTPYVNDPVWGLSIDEQADFYPGFWAEDLVAYNNISQDRRLGIPFYRSAYALFYNQSWAKELGFPDPPLTPNDFKLQACTATVSLGALSDKSDLARGGWLIAPQPGELVGWIFTFGGGITNPSAPGYRFNTPETRQAFEYIKELLESGCAWSEAGADPQKVFANRQALFVVGSLFDIPAQQEAFVQAGSTDKWVVIPFPSNSKRIVDSYGPSLLTTRSTPAQQLAAWLVVEWLVYPPNMAKWVKELETYPTRQSTLNYINEDVSASPQWAEAMKLLPDTRSEPSLASWSVMRWALNDTMDQLINPKFSADQIPSLLENLDGVASEIYKQVH